MAINHISKQMKSNLLPTKMWLCYYIIIHKRTYFVSSRKLHEQYKIHLNRKLSTTESLSQEIPKMPTAIESNGLALNPSKSYLHC